MGFLAKLLPSEPKFYEMFGRVGAYLRQGAELFVQMVEAPTSEQRATLARRIKEVEHENDLLTHEIFDQLHKAFITPIDREDIHLLASSLDDILDLTHSTADRIVVYQVDRISDEMKSLGRVLRSTTEMVCNMIGNLGALRGRASIANFMREIHTRENEGDSLYSAAMARLFANGTPVIEVIKWKDIYLGVEQAIDKCEHVANVIEGIAIKHS